MDLYDRESCRHEPLGVGWALRSDAVLLCRGALSYFLAAWACGGRQHTVRPDFRVIVSDERGDLFITSGVRFDSGAAPADAFTLEDVAGVAVVPELAKGEKCGRCWKVLEDVGSNPNHPEVCPRCADAAEHNPGPTE